MVREKLIIFPSNSNGARIHAFLALYKGNYKLISALAGPPSTHSLEAVYVVIAGKRIERRSHACMQQGNRRRCGGESLRRKKWKENDVTFA